MVHFSNAICTKIKPCAPLLCTSTWNISTLSFMWEKTNDKVFSPWGLVFPTGPFFRGSVFSQVQGLSPVFRRYHNIYQIIMMMDVTKIMNQTKQNLNRDKWCNMKDCHARNWKYRRWRRCKDEETNRKQETISSCASCEKKDLEFIVKFGDCKDWTYICTKLPPYMLSSLIKETR